MAAVLGLTGVGGRGWPGVRQTRELSLPGGPEIGHRPRRVTRDFTVRFCGASFHSSATPPPPHAHLSEAQLSLTGVRVPSRTGHISLAED